METSLKTCAETRMEEDTKHSFIRRAYMESLFWMVDMYIYISAIKQHHNDEL